MTQPTLPTWVPIVLGGGGIVGASTILFNLFKQVTDAKDAHIKRLEGSISSLEKQHEREIEFIKVNHNREIDNLHRELESKKQELAELGSFMEIIESTVDDLSRQEMTPEIRSSLKKIEGFLIDIDRNREILKSTRTAAEWLSYKRETWVNQAVKSAARRYPDILTTEKIELFKADILKYLDWVYDSLSHGFTCRMEDYVRNPKISPSFPYKAAFQELAEISDFGQLSDSEVKDLQDYISELPRRAFS
jgi:acetolactate synthase small subunit